MPQKFFKTFFYIVILFSMKNFAQQSQKVSGKIIDSQTKLPIVGANIVIKKLNIKTVSDFDGSFFLTLKSNNPSLETLQITVIGYQTKTIKVGNTNYLTIALQEDKADLQEVIITSSYGTKKRKEETVGSIVSLKSSDLQVQQSAESFDKLLDGLAAGVLVTAGNTISSPVKIEIRGQGTLTPLNGNLLGTSSQPLIIIDGVVMAEERGFDSEIFDGSGLLTEQFKNSLSKISPEDIDTVTILKDAAAVGLYGSDAANGVILVTTKRSKSQKIDFNLSTQTGFSSPINQIKYLNGSQFYDLRKEYLQSQGQSASQAATNAGSRTIDTNWFELMNRDGSFQRYNFNVGFGIKNWNFRTSFNTLLNNETQIGNDFTRYGGNINAGYSTKKFAFQLAVSPSFTVQNNPNTLANFPLAPNSEVFDSNGDFALLGFLGFGNPLAVAKQNLNQTKTAGTVGSLNISYFILPNLKISSLVGIDFSDKNQSRFFNGLNESGRFNGTFTATNPDGTTSTYNNWGRRLDYRRNELSWNQSTQIYYEKKVGRSSFDGLIGLELRRSKTDLRQQNGRGFINFGTIQEATAANGVYQTATYLNEEARRSVFSQFNYNFDKKYFLLANLRRDESSAFGADVNAAINGGLGASWNMSSEKFLEKSSWLNFLRIRASWGVTGNSRIGSYRALGLYFNDITGFDGYNGNFFATPETAPNRNLSWEQNYKSNIGLDINILKNKYKFVIEVFRDIKRDLIVGRDTPPETGFTNIQINGAAMRNQGVEFSVAANWITSKNFVWTSSFNIAKIKNVTTELTGIGDDFSAAGRARAQKVGVSTTAIWGIRSAGIDPATGRELFTKNGQLYDAATYTSLFRPKDWEIIGDSNPDFFGGFQNNFLINKNFTISFRMNFKYGGDVLIDNNFYNYNITINRNLSVNVLDRWQKPGDIATEPRVSSSNPVVPNSTRFLYDASNIKLQNINLSYQLPIKKMNISFLDAASFSCDVSNIYYFYKEKSLRGRNGIAEYANQYPEARTLTFGFQANF